MAYACSICNKTYARSSHLRRHENSHKEGCRLECHSCKKSFSRSDVFRRHLLKCHSLPVPAVKPGRKRLACDRCAGKKLSCDQEMPCERCSAAGDACSYSRLPTSSRPTLQPPSVDGECEPVSGSANKPSTQDDKTLITFLLSYANPTTSFADLRQLPGNDSDGVGTPQVLSISDTIFSEALYRAFDWPVIGHPDEIEPFPILSLLQDVQPIDSLQKQVDDVLNDLASHASLMRQNLDDVHLASAALTNAHEYITTSDLRMAIGAYFKYVHCNCPVVHQPSFNMHTVSPTLLLATFASGYTVLQPHLCALPTELLMVIEDFIFHIISLNIHDNGHASDLGAMDIESLQAAIIFTSMLVATNDTVVQQRLRDRRFVTLLNVLRHHSLFSSKNSSLSHHGSAFFDWQRFIQEESVVRIAFMAFVFDAQFMMFFRSPPRITIQEMSGDLPCPDVVFMAESSHVCQESLSNLPQPRPPCLAVAVESLMAESYPHHQKRSLQNHTIRGLFILIEALHLLIFIAQTNCTMTHLSHQVERALHRWKDLWDLSSTDMTEEQLTGAGFMKFGLHFWHLAMVLVLPTAGCPPSDKINLWSRDYMYEHLQEAARQSNLLSE